MFSPEKDERLWRIELESAMTALSSYFFLVLGLMITKRFVEGGVLYDPAFVLVVPWLFTGLVWFVAGWKKGLYAAIREENTRTRTRLKNTRSTLLLNVAGFAVLMFLGQRLQLFSDTPQSLAEDFTDTVSLALLWGLAMWFLTGRKSRIREE
jgi:uncharacterized membrane protein HdeD (DUF308 family)